jgi:hypothetical protein
MNNAPVLIVGIDIVPIAGLPAPTTTATAAAAAAPTAPTVIAVIERRKILSARWRSASSRQRQRLVPSHPLYSSSSVAAGRTVFVVAAAKIGITTTTMPMVIAVAIPILVEQQWQSR